MSLIFIVSACVLAGGLVATATGYVNPAVTYATAISILPAGLSGGWTLASLRG